MRLTHEIEFKRAGALATAISGNAIVGMLSPRRI
jgi:hypothetical protein